MIGCLVFYGGVGQFIAGIMEFITGNTVTPLRTKEQ
jgi:succinate-acetate transporter protein